MPFPQRCGGKSQPAPWERTRTVGAMCAQAVRPEGLPGASLEPSGRLTSLHTYLEVSSLPPTPHWPVTPQFCLCVGLSSPFDWKFPEARSYPCFYQRWGYSCKNPSVLEPNSAIFPGVGRNQVRSAILWSYSHSLITEFIILNRLVGGRCPRRTCEPASKDQD